MLLGVIAIAVAQTTAGFSIVPLWPANGLPTQEESRSSYVFFDPSKEEYVLYYPSDLDTAERSSGKMETIRIELQNRARPEIAVEMNSGEQGIYKYEYSLRNGASAKSPISTWALVAAAGDDNIRLNHARWQSYGSTAAKPVVAPQAAVLDGPELRKQANMGKFVRWIAPQAEANITRGNFESGFTIVSSYRPGWTTAYVAAGKGIQLPHAIPAPVLAQLQVLQQPENYNSVALTVGPKFSPTDTGVYIAADWDLAVQKLISRRVLSEESTFVKSVQQFLDSVIHGQSPAAISFPSTAKTVAEKEISTGLSLALNLR